MKEEIGSVNAASVEKTESPTSFYCEGCDQEFGCGKLKTALTILESELSQALGSNPIEKDRYYSLMLKLAQKRWNYPYGLKPCELADRGDLVRKLTSEAISILESRRKLC